MHCIPTCMEHPLANGSAIKDALPTEICENDLRNMFLKTNTINGLSDYLAQSFFKKDKSFILLLHLEILNFVCALDLLSLHDLTIQWLYGLPEWRTIFLATNLCLGGSRVTY